MSTDEFILELVKEARKTQEIQWGTSEHSDLVWLAILMEELGEAARSINYENLGELQQEVVRISAVALGWLEQLTER